MQLTSRASRWPWGLALGAALGLAACAGDAPPVADAEPRQARQPSGLPHAAGGAASEEQVDDEAQDEEWAEDAAVSPIEAAMRRGIRSDCKRSFEPGRPGCAMAAFLGAGSMVEFPPGPNWYVGTEHLLADAATDVGSEQAGDRTSLIVLLLRRSARGQSALLLPLEGTSRDEDALLAEVGPAVEIALAGWSADAPLPGALVDVLDTHAAALDAPVLPGDAGWLLDDGRVELRRVSGGWVAGSVEETQAQGLLRVRVATFTDLVSSLRTRD